MVDYLSYLQQGYKLLYFILMHVNKSYWHIDMALFKLFKLFSQDYGNDFIV